MADREAADTPASTPDSQAGAQSGPKVSKDRSCPFCGQAFTSSSLGRHLDLYIRPKNPKPPDGVHDVDEIRRIRGGVTRRQPRTGPRASTAADASSVGGRESGSWAQGAADGQHPPQRRSAAFAHGDRDDNDSPDPGPDSAGRDDLEDARLQSFAKWQATGVINDLPSRKAADDDAPSGQAQRLKEMRRDLAGHRVQRPDYETEGLRRLEEQAEVGRAAEMALREVLGSLEAAKKRVEEPLLFEGVDIFALSFPALCLALLPPPPTLFSASPFAVPHAWFVGPPGRAQFEAMNRAISDQIAARRNVHGDSFPDTALFRHYAHTQGAFEHWQTLSDAEQREVWQLEVMRAFARERERVQQGRRELDAAQQRNRHLEAEFDRLSRCQLPRDYLLHPINTLSVPAAVGKEMSTAGWKSGAADTNYDADALIAKWRTTVKIAARAARPSAASTPAIPRYDTVYVETGRSELKDDMYLNGSVWSVNGPMPRAADAPGATTSASHHHRHQLEPAASMYRTPPEPGAVVDDDDDDDDDGPSPATDPEAERDPPRDPAGPSQHPARDRNSALVRLRHDPDHSLASWREGRSPVAGHPAAAVMDGELNAHGKRPFAPAAEAGRPSLPKMYKERGM